MLLILAFLWGGCLLVIGLRAWARTPDLPSPLRPLRFAAAAFPALLLATMGLSEAPSFWSHLPTVLASPWLAWPILALWALMVARNLALLARMASADRRLVGGAWRLEALATAPEIGYPTLAYRMGLRRAPTLMGSPEIASPVTVGAPSPVILLPLAWIPPAYAQFPPEEGDPPPGPEELQAALAHELAHVARRDTLRHLFDLLGCLILPLEALPLPAFKNLRQQAGLPGPLRQLALMENQAEEHIADQSACRLVPGGQVLLDHLRGEESLVQAKPPLWNLILRQALLVGAGLSILLLAPSRLDLAHAVGTNLPFPGRLPEGWVISVPFPRNVSYGFLPAGPGREAAIHLHQKAGSSVLGHYTFVDRPALEGAQRLDLEMDFEVEEGRVPEGTVAGFLLVPFDAPDRFCFQSWVATRLGDSLRVLGPNRFRFQNSLELEGRDLGRIRDLWVEVQIQGSGHFTLHPPRLWMLNKNGERHPYPSVLTKQQEALGRSFAPL